MEGQVEPQKELQEGSGKVLESGTEQGRTASLRGGYRGCCREAHTARG